MDNQEQQPRRMPQRRRRSKLQTFKEAYLPVIILALAIVLIIVFIIGGSGNEEQPSQSTPGTTVSSSQQTQNTQMDPALAQEMLLLLNSAAESAKIYDYIGAMNTLESFSGVMEDYPAIADAYNQYAALDAAMVSWTPAQVRNLSFHMLIADPARAFADHELGSSYRKNFITVSEFSGILQELYDNGFILVGLDDLYESKFSVSSGRDVMQEKALRLPEGKKPIMLSQINASYYYYMTDSNGDKLPDAGGDGFASKLCYGPDGFYTEYVDADGVLQQGAHDMVPILEAFIAAHPDFSYRGARAVIAFAGSDGVLGHRVNAKHLDAESLQAEKEAAATVTRALKSHGYTLACYTYGNVNYGNYTASDIQNDLAKWEAEITPVIGKVDVLAFARESDISDSSPYNSSKFTVLYNAGFRYFMGTSSTAFNQVGDLFVRHNRLMITGENLDIHQDWYFHIFDPLAVTDPARK